MIFIFSLENQKKNPTLGEKCIPQKGWGGGRFCTEGNTCLQLGSGGRVWYVSEVSSPVFSVAGVQNACEQPGELGKRVLNAVLKSFSSHL